jgi:hypothetical protein
LEVGHKMGNQISADCQISLPVRLAMMASAFFTSVNGYPSRARSGMIEIRPRATLEGRRENALISHNLPSRTASRTP